MGKANRVVGSLAHAVPLISLPAGAVDDVAEKLLSSYPHTIRGYR
ncbi:MAG: hypothetical protein V3U73_08915 [bacterium]